MKPSEPTDYKWEYENLCKFTNDLEAKLAIAVEALKFYAEEPCMTLPTIKPPENLPFHDLSKWIIEVTTGVVRKPAIDALVKLRELRGKKEG